MALVARNGFEDPTTRDTWFTAGAGGGGSAGYDTVAARSGSWSNFYTVATGAVRNQSRLFGGTILVFSGMLRMASLPTTNAREVMRNYYASQTKIASLTVSSTGVMQARFGTTATPATASSAAGAIVVDTWHLIELRVNVGIANPTMEWRIDGVDQTQPAADTGSTLMHSVYFGSADTLASATYTLRWDDVNLFDAAADYPAGFLPVLDIPVAPQRRPLLPRLHRFGRLSAPQLGFPLPPPPDATGPPPSPAIELVTETDTAQPVGRLKSQAIGLVTVTNTAQSIAARKTRALGLVSELDTAQAISRSKSRPLGLVSVTNTAQTFGRSKSRPLGLVLETDTVWSIVRVGATHTVGLVSELDTVFSIARVKSRAIGLVVETDTAQAASRRKAKALGLVSATNTAQSFTRLRSRSLGLVSATNLALAFTHAKRRALGLATELDTALEISGPTGEPLPAFDSEQGGRMGSRQRGTTSAPPAGRTSSSTRGAVTSVQRGRMST